MIDPAFMQGDFVIYVHKTSKETSCGHRLFLTKRTSRESVDATGTRRVNCNHFTDLTSALSTLHWQLAKYLVMLGCSAGPKFNTARHPPFKHCTAVNKCMCREKIFQVKLH